jgi:hypothetical protein
MRKLTPVLLGLSLAAAGSLPATVQGQSMAGASAPKFLQVTVEYTKPGKGGMAHDKTESAFVQAMAKIKFPIHYTAFNAMTGRPRAIYLSGFNSFEELAKANKLFEAPAAAAEFERINAADGDLLEEAHTLFFSSVPEMSYHSKAPGPQNRLLEADIVQVRPGHGKDFADLMKVYIAVADKIGSIDHWAAYTVEYGEPVGYYVFLTASNSATEIDARFAEEPKYDAALTDEDKKKISDLRAAAIESEHIEMYTINPAQSYPTDDYIKADPTFWKPKPAAAPAAKPAAEAKKTTP